MSVSVVSAALTVLMKKMNCGVRSHQSSNGARGIAPLSPLPPDPCLALPSIHNSCDVSWLQDGDTAMLSAAAHPRLFVFAGEPHINESQAGKANHAGLSKVQRTPASAAN